MLPDGGSGELDAVAFALHLDQSEIAGSSAEVPDQDQFIMRTEHFGKFYLFAAHAGQCIIADFNGRNFPADFGSFGAKGHQLFAEIIEFFFGRSKNF